jgi:hypothetical protein
LGGGFAVQGTRQVMVGGPVVHLAATAGICAGEGVGNCPLYRDGGL